MQRSAAEETQRQNVWRKVLRALNGAGIGAVAGGVLGASLAVLSALIVGMAPGIEINLVALSRDWLVYATLGAVPGTPTGLLLGTTIIIRSDRKRVLTGTVVGLLVGVAYAEYWRNMLRDQWVVLSSIWISGAIGGAVLALMLTAIRYRWGWWTRWEDQDLSSSAVTDAGGKAID